jgi:hypothetical protein
MRRRGLWLKRTDSGCAARSSWHPLDHGRFDGGRFCGIKPGISQAELPAASCGAALFKTAADSMAASSFAGIVGSSIFAVILATSRMNDISVSALAGAVAKYRLAPYLQRASM